MGLGVCEGFSIPTPTPGQLGTCRHVPFQLSPLLQASPATTCCTSQQTPQGLHGVGRPDSPFAPSIRTAAIAAQVWGTLQRAFCWLGRTDGFEEKAGGVRHGTRRSGSSFLICMTLGVSLSFCVPQHPDLQNGDNSPHAVSLSTGDCKLFGAQTVSVC